MPIPYLLQYTLYRAEVNYGGSTGFGKQFTNLISGNYGGEECTDIEAAIQSTCQRYQNELDSTKVFITGASYGGYLTVLLGLKYPELAKGLVAVSGQYDWQNYPEALQKAKDASDYEMRLKPYKFISELQTPLLLIHGINDDICSVAESYKMFNAAVSAQKSVSLYTHETDHFFDEWWINKVVSTQVMAFLENLKNDTYHPPLHKPLPNKSRYDEETVFGDEL